MLIDIMVRWRFKKDSHLQSECKVQTAKCKTVKQIPCCMVKIFRLN